MKMLKPLQVCDTNRYLVYAAEAEFSGRHALGPHAANAFSLGYFTFLFSV